VGAADDVAVAGAPLEGQLRGVAVEMDVAELQLPASNTLITDESVAVAIPALNSDDDYKNGHIVIPASEDSIEPSQVTAVVAAAVVGDAPTAVVAASTVDATTAFGAVNAVVHGVTVASEAATTDAGIAVTVADEDAHASSADAASGTAADTGTEEAPMEAAATAAQDAAVAAGSIDGASIDAAAAVSVDATSSTADMPKGNGAEADVSLAAETAQVSPPPADVVALEPIAAASASVSATGDVSITAEAAPAAGGDVATFSSVFASATAGVASTAAAFSSATPADAHGAAALSAQGSAAAAAAAAAAARAEAIGGAVALNDAAVAVTTSVATVEVAVSASASSTASTTSSPEALATARAVGAAVDVDGALDASSAPPRHPAPPTLAPPPATSTVPTPSPTPWLSRDDVRSLARSGVAAFWLGLLAACVGAIAWALYLAPALVIDYVEHLTKVEAAVWGLAFAVALAATAWFMHLSWTAWLGLTATVAAMYGLYLL